MLTFAELELKFKTTTNWSRSIKLDHNTYASYTTDCVDIKLHGNIIAKLSKDKSVQILPYCYLDSEGRVSSTTKKRLNSFGWGLFYLEKEQLYFYVPRQSSENVYRQDVEQGDILHLIDGKYVLSPKIIKTKVSTFDEMLKDIRGVAALLNQGSVELNIKRSGSNLSGIPSSKSLLNFYKPYCEENCETRITVSRNLEQVDTPFRKLSLLNTLSSKAVEVYQKELAKLARKSA